MVMWASFTASSDGSYVAYESTVTRRAGAAPADANLWITPLAAEGDVHVLAEPGVDLQVLLDRPDHLVVGDLLDPDAHVVLHLVAVLGRRQRHQVAAGGRGEPAHAERAHEQDGDVGDEPRVPDEAALALAADVEHAVDDEEGDPHDAQPGDEDEEVLPRLDQPPPARHHVERGQRVAQRLAERLGDLGGVRAGGGADRTS